MLKKCTKCLSWSFQKKKKTVFLICWKEYRILLVTCEYEWIVDISTFESIEHPQIIIMKENKMLQNTLGWK